MPALDPVAFAHALERAVWIDCERVPQGPGSLEGLETTSVPYEWRLLGILIWAHGGHLVMQRSPGFWSAHPLGGTMLVSERPLPASVEMITRLSSYPRMSHTCRLHIHLRLDGPEDADVGARVLAWPM